LKIPLQANGFKQKPPTMKLYKIYFLIKLNTKKESATKDVLKPICNGDCIILDRSVAKNQNNAIIVTVRLQSFGTRLKAVDLPHLMG